MSDDTFNEMADEILSLRGELEDAIGFGQKLLMEISKVADRDDICGETLRFDVKQKCIQGVAALAKRLDPVQVDTAGITRGGKT